MHHCTNCGRELKNNREFCPGCGQQVHQQENSPTSRVGRSKGFNKPATSISLFILIALLVGGAFYIGGKYSPQKASNVSGDPALKNENTLPVDEKKKKISQNEAIAKF